MSTARNICLLSYYHTGFFFTNPSFHDVNLLKLISQPLSLLIENQGGETIVSQSKPKCCTKQCKSEWDGQLDLCLFSVQVLYSGH